MGGRMKGWLREYSCSCTEVQRYKKELTGYCGYHGEDAINTYRIDDITDLKVGHDRDVVEEDE